MGITVVQSGITGDPVGTDLTTTAVDTAGADLIVLMLASWVPGTIPTVDDSKGNTWTGLTASVGSDYRVRLFYCNNPTVGPGHTFHCDHGGTGASGSYPVLGFLAVSGAAAAGAESETGAHNNAGALSLQAGSVTPGEDGALIVTGLAYEFGASAAIDSGFSSLSVDGDVSKSSSAALGWLIQGTAAAVNPTWSWSGGNPSAATIAVFAPAGGGGGDATPPTLGTGTVPAGGVTLTATLSESGCTPASGTGGFTLGGTAATVASWAISGTTLTLTLSGLIYASDAVTLSYSRAATADDIADAAGNFLADFSGASVTNNSTQVAPLSSGPFLPEGRIAMFRDTAGQKLNVYAYQVVSGLPVPKTADAANITARVSKDDAASAALADSSAAEDSAANDPGWYTFDLAQAETDAGKLKFTARSTTPGVNVIPVPAVAETTDALTAVPADVQAWKGAAPNDLVSGKVDANATASLGATAPANWINAAALDPDATAELQSGLATAAALAAVAGYVDTEVAAIKAKTDNLPASPAAVGSAMTLAPAGVDGIVVETGLNLRQAVAILLAYVAGVKTGVTGTGPTVKNPAGTATRATPTVDADGNCSAVTLNPPA